MEKDFPLKISVVMPVCNNRHSVRSSVGSILAQTMAPTDFELILVDDGSVDESGDICRALAENNENIIFFHKENGGVSSARNLGISKARGKYIMFLDADDTISMNALKEVYDFFEEYGAQTDVVTYRINYAERGSVGAPHKRFEILKKRAVYSLDEPENYNILQTTINVCVKNDGSVLFDEGLDLAEDQLFITEKVMKKRAIGFVPNAVYTYNRSPFSSSSLKSHPHICFDEVMRFFSRLTDSFAKSGKLHPYVQSLILYNMWWRAASDKLVAHGLSDEDNEKCLEYLSGCLKPVSVKTICNFIYADARAKLFFLSLKDKKCRVFAGASGYSVVCANEPVFCSDKADISFSRLTVRGGKLIATGRLDTVVPEYAVQELLVNGESVPLFVSRGRGIGQLPSMCFDLRIPVDGGGTFDFAVRLNGRGKVGVELFFGPFCRVNGEIRTAACGGYILHSDASKGVISAVKSDKKELSALRGKEDSHILRNDLRAWAYRAAQKRFFGKRVWLYSDAAGVYGNGYLQFLHDLAITDGVKRYYILNDGNAKKALKKKCLRRRDTAFFGSRKHKLLFLMSEKIFASYISPDIVCPFGREPMRRYSDIFDGEIIYLQHGVMHADLPHLYAKEKCLADKIVVSSRFEKEKLKNSYHYRDDELIESGMPELEVLDEKHEPFGRLLYMPSWRASYIGGFIKSSRAADELVFRSSDFYKAVSNLLRSEGLAAFLAKNNLCLDIKSHPIFRCYDRFFENKNDRISFVSSGVCAADYPLLITDFSSCVFDFVYLRRPVIYFVPDYELFLSGALHNYSSLDIPLEEGFGAMAHTVGELVGELEKIVDNGFQADPKYKNRMDSFFDCRGVSHRKLLYDSLKQPSV
ncbi:MAG: glycosyltransferase [Clostridiales bacterium]|nr:glycosyltransferase [Clostridiales bacterium]